MVPPVGSVSNSCLTRVIATPWSPDGDDRDDHARGDDAYGDDVRESAYALGDCHPPCERRREPGEKRRARGRRADDERQPMSFVGRPYERDVDVRELVLSGGRKDARDRGHGDEGGREQASQPARVERDRRGERHGERRPRAPAEREVDGRRMNRDDERGRGCRKRSTVRDEAERDEDRDRGNRSKRVRIAERLGEAVVEQRGVMGDEVIREDPRRKAVGADQ